MPISASTTPVDRHLNALDAPTSQTRAAAADDRSHPPPAGGGPRPSATSILTGPTRDAWITAPRRLAPGAFGARSARRAARELPRRPSFGAGALDGCVDRVLTIVSTQQARIADTSPVTEPRIGAASRCHGALRRGTRRSASGVHCDRSFRARLPSALCRTLGVRGGLQAPRLRTGAPAGSWADVNTATPPPSAAAFTTDGS